MSCKVFNKSIIAASILAATSANAALYNIVEVDPSADIEANGVYSAEFTEFYASALEAVDEGSITDPDSYLGCFATGVSCQDFTLYGDTLNGSEGHSYRQEVPFNYDSRFYYTSRGRNEDYCDGQLGYATCESWADKLWYSFSDFGGLERERNAFEATEYLSNAHAFVGSNKLAVSPSSVYVPGGTSTLNSNSENTVINSVTADGAIIGTTSSGYYSLDSGNLALAYRQRGYLFDDTASTTTMLLPLANDENATEDQIRITEQMGRSMAWDSFSYNGETYVVGSASVGPFDYGDSDKDWTGDLNNCVGSDVLDPAALADCQNFAFASKATVWKLSDTDSATNTLNAIEASAWNRGTSRNVEERAMQGSVRGAAIAADSISDLQDQPVLVGLNSYADDDELFMEATVFIPQVASGSVDIDAGQAWSPIRISKATIKDDGDYVYSNSYAADVNQNLVVVGAAKRRGNNPENGAMPNRMFLTEIEGNDTDGYSASAKYFDDINSNSGIFFRGVGGEIGAINNFNEIVGSVDAEQSREDGGKQRRRRGFIYPYDADAGGSVDDRMAIFDNQPWLLDDLTNSGDALESNNQYRIISASDINDDGVIAATAIKCENGYDTTAHNSLCGSGSITEKVVSVKLIPIAESTAEDIKTRAVESDTISREGGSLGGSMLLILMTMLGLRRNK
ncbi:DUF3466 family protein [Vibrio hippocampi]|uniref:GlyGly-CTERM sorting domain-containing protein n=1 Tax=Vibrio hippocampi TaxID=654686 RepID=A0ABN8DHW1_9VIBR|nr:DUF3466 family protein [Vibrio hippocampi]CAH0525997.1 hypothetical protein VHP8226_01479 [Vibrio hippocampi]